ncbi:STAS-like domain-containing protein [Chloroflexota bacterium]
MRQTAVIRDYLLKNIEEYPTSISRMASEKFGVTRQAINLHINKLLNEGLIHAEGKTRNRNYKLKPITEKFFKLKISPELDEDTVWRTYLAQLLHGFKQNIVNISHYGFTEMYNNVIDHSEGENVLIKFIHFAGRIEFIVDDDGVGIFNKISNALGLNDKRQAILELAKGKLTTDPERHTGEGIFFTTRMFDKYSILSSNLYFTHALGEDWLIEDRESGDRGTFIQMWLKTDTTRTVKEVFDKYATEANDYGFRRTHVPLNLASYGGENLVSRSQAKRVLSRFERFDEIFLDFSGVEFIGQAFADEIFRVFVNNNPGKKMIVVNDNDNIKQTIQRVSNRA